MHIDLRLDLHRSRLANGIELLVVPIPTARTAAFALVARVGSRHDPPERQGLAHLLEHMLFRGTARFAGARQLNAAIEATGAPLSASVMRDQTVFEMPTFPETLPDALALLGEMLREPRFADLEIEREVVLQERLDEVDERGRPNDVDNLAMRSLFPRQGLGWSIIGTRRSIAAIKVDDLRAHLARHYVGSNLILSVAGPLQAAEVQAIAERTLGRLPAGRVGTPPPAQPRADLPAVALANDEDSRAKFDLSLVTAPAGDPDSEALDLLLRVLDDGASSRLRARLCDDLGLAYEIGVHAEVYTDVGLMRISGAVAPDRLAPVVHEVGRVLASLRREPVAPEELERVRRWVMLDLLSVLDSPESLASWLAEEALYGRVGALQASIARLLRLEPADVGGVAQRYFRASRCQLAAVGELRRHRRRLEQALAELG